MKPAAERTAAEKASLHVMDRIIRDPRVTYFFGPGSETWNLVTEAVADLRGEAVDDYRASIRPHLRTERPA